MSLVDTVEEGTEALLEELDEWIEERKAYAPPPPPPSPGPCVGGGGGSLMIHEKFDMRRLEAGKQRAMSEGGQAGI